MQQVHTNEDDDVINLKSKSSHAQNRWNDDIDDDIINKQILIPIRNTFNIKK
jgi:hypothetical protein